MPGLDPLNGDDFETELPTLADLHENPEEVGCSVSVLLGILLVVLIIGGLVIVALIL
jgi:hypothetical protein